MRKILIKFSFIIFDIIFLILIFYLSKLIRLYFVQYGLVFNDISLNDFLFVIIIIEILFYHEKIYNYRFDFWQEFFKIEKAIFLSFFITLTILALTKMNIQYSRLFIIIYFINLIILLPLYKYTTKYIFFKFSFYKEPILIIGKKDMVKKIRKEMLSNWYFGYYIDKKMFDNIIIVSKGLDIKSIDRIIDKNYKRCKNIFIVPFLSSINFAHSDVLEYSNIRLNSVHFKNQLFIKKNIIIKKISDKLITLSIFPFFIILHFIISILIKIDSNGSIFYKQNRLGKYGKTFKIYKYRTMYEDGDKILKEYLKNNKEEIDYYNKYHKYKNDPRVTKIGKLLRKTSLDELPQIINILKSEMSLVGPRPYMLKELEYIGDFKDIILKVSPGITGLWQVSGRNDLSFNERIELEKWYVKNWSLLLDITIIFKTLKVVLLQKGSK